MKLQPEEPAADDGPSQRRSSWRSWVVGATSVFAVLLLADIYLAYHRQLIVVNGFEDTISVGLTGRTSLDLAPGARGVLTLSEGDHRIQVTGPVTETIPIQIPQSRRERWLGGSDRLLNPGGAALLVLETLSANEARTTRWIVGDRFVEVPAVDFLFSEFPENASPSGDKTVTRFDWVRIPLPDLIDALASAGRIADALRLLEWHLRLHPDRIALLTPYVGLSLAAGQAAQARDFLQWGTTLEPLSMQWHRLYQDMAMHTGQNTQVAAHYDELLRLAPTNSALIYLRGRLCTHRHEALPYYERALRADASNAFAHNATAFVYAGAGDWKTALEHARRAVQLNPDDRQMQDLLFDSQLAAGSLEELEQEWRRLADAKQTDLLAHSRLATILAARGKTTELDQLVQSYVKKVSDTYGPQAGSGWQLKYQASYLKGDFAAVLALVRDEPDRFHPYETFQALLAASQLDAIERTVQPETATQFDPFHLLLVGLAWQHAEHPERGIPWKEEAMKRLRSERPEYALTAEMLAHPEETALTDVLDLSIAPQPKAILLAALSLSHPAQAEPMRLAARRLNARREFPYHWINRLTEPISP